MKALFSYILFGILSICTLQLFSQSFTNTISITGGNTFFPNWIPKTNSFGTGYTYWISKNCIIQGRVTAAISNENIIYEPSKEFSYELVNYDEIQYRNLVIFEAKVGYNIFRDINENIFIFVNAGLSYITGKELIINSIWYGDFPESEVSTNFRNHPGINGGLEFLYFPLKKVGIGVFASGHTYLKYDPHLSIGASINFRFGQND